MYVNVLFVVYMGSCVGEREVRRSYNKDRSLDEKVVKDFSWEKLVKEYNPFRIFLGLKIDNVSMDLVDNLEKI